MAGEIPGSFALEQNYPNPFNPSTTISFDVPKQSHLRLAIYDVLGREVKTLVDEEKNPGRYSVTFDASNLPSGVYLYRLEAGSFSEVRKMVESGSGDLF
ncbi:MAG: T9SS type A sorting domain-containing protein [Bacteroidota bacterium]